MTPALVEGLRRIVGPRWVRDRKAELATYRMDGLPTHESLPGAVVMPRTRASGPPQRTGDWPPSARQLKRK